MELPPSGFASGSGDREGRAAWTAAMVEEALVECHELWRRSPGAGRWPYAGDGPWHLAQGEVGDIKGEWSITLLVTEAGKELPVRKIDTPAPRVPLRVAEVAARDRISEWLALLPDPADRIIVRAAVPYRSRGERPEWKRMAGTLAFPVIESGEVVRHKRWDRAYTRMAGRYLEALWLIAGRLDARPERWARQMASRGFR